MPSNASIREEITRQIVEAIEQNKSLPWRKPWRSSPHSGMPTSVSSGKPYRGINIPLLHVFSTRFGFTSKWWATYRQWQQLGGQVKRRPDGVESGAWSATAVLYKPVTKTRTEAGEEVEDKFFLLRTFRLFNADQVEGAEKFQVTDEPTGIAIPNFEPVDQLIEAAGIDVRHHGDKAYYQRPTPEDAWPNHDDGDFIVMPSKSRFDSVAGYYETLLHEASHFSELRVGFDHRQHGYAFGELVAEMSASFLSQELGVPQSESVVENHAAYVKNWLDAMRGDSSFIFKASTQASKVSDYLLSFVEQEAEQPEPAIIV